MSNDKPGESSSKSGNTNSNLQEVKLISTDGIKTETGSSSVKNESVAAKEKTLSKLHTISKITENTTVMATLSTLASTTTTTTTTVSHPRPIQPRPTEMKNNYETLLKSYSLNGIGNKVCNSVFFFTVLSFSLITVKFKILIQGFAIIHFYC